MQQGIIMPVSEDRLKAIIKEAVREEVSRPLKKLRSAQELMAPKEAMELLNIASYNTLKSMWTRGDIEMVIIGKRPKIKRESVENYIKNK
jgi:hypothetical protein